MTISDAGGRSRGLGLSDLMVVVVVTALPLAGAVAPTATRVSPAVVAALEAALLAGGHLLWWLPGLAALKRWRWLEVVVLPVYMALAVVLTGLGAVAIAVCPASVVLVAAAYGVTLIHLEFRR